MFRLPRPLTKALPVSAASVVFVVVAIAGAWIDADLHPAAAAPRFWYYCDNPAGYFPYVQSCNGQYRAVPVPDDYGAATVSIPSRPKHHHHHKHIASLTGASAPASAAAPAGSAGASSPPPADLDDPGGPP